MRWDDEAKLLEAAETISNCLDPDELEYEVNRDKTRKSVLPLDRQEHLKNCSDCQQLIEAAINPVYCKTCGSCGIEGCCSPALCKQVSCLYGEQSLVSYKAMCNDYETQYQLLERVKFAVRTNDLAQAKELLGLDPTVVDYTNQVPERVA